MGEPCLVAQPAAGRVDEGRGLPTPRYHGFLRDNDISRYVLSDLFRSC